MSEPRNPTTPETPASDEAPDSSDARPTLRFNPSMVRDVVRNAPQAAPTGEAPREDEPLKTLRVDDGTAAKLIADNDAATQHEDETMEGSSDDPPATERAPGEEMLAASDTAENTAIMPERATPEPAAPEAAAPSAKEPAVKAPPRPPADDDDDDEPPAPPQSGFAERVLPLIAAAIVVAATIWLVARGRQAPGVGLPTTIADLQAVHADVSLHGAPVRGVARASARDTIETGESGRARLRLDDGTQIVIDRATSLTLDPAGVSLTKGRIFVLGAPGARTEIDLGGAKALITNANAGIDRREGGAAKVYSANEEISLHEGGGADVPLRAGFSATIEGGKAKIAPEKAFDDWTGGMAAPWGVNGAPRRAVGELWARAGTSEASQQVTMRSHEVRATIVGEIAKTEISTTFFNAGSTTVNGDYRLAIPEGAIVSRFAVDHDGSQYEGRLALASRDQGAVVPDYSVLEWAGEGWVRGSILSIPSGKTAKVIVEYTEWLTPRPVAGTSHLAVQYRYPMAADTAPPQIGDFYARVDASGSAPISVAAGLGATVSGGVVEVRRPDFRPTADLVVDVEIASWPAAARMYLVPPMPDDDEGATVVVRTEAPQSGGGAPSGVTLALVMDTSQSVDPALFDAERAVVTAIVGGLGAQDKVQVVAADQTARPIGPEKIGPADDARKKAILAALGKVTTGGATDLGRALEAGADALPPDSPAAMVIYVGDGWPTVGDASPDRVLARLARRPGGAPRLGAALVGPLVNRLGMAALVRGQGPLLEVRDSADAAQTAVALLAEALQPTIAGVELSLGPEVERVYPRGARAALAGGAVMAVGRVRGRAPESVVLRYRDEKGVHEEPRSLIALEPLDENDVVRRWASARIDEIALRNGGREAAADVAMRSGILTPWTGFVLGGTRTYTPSSFGTRLLDLGAGPEGGFGAVFGTTRLHGTLGSTTQGADFSETDEGDDAFKAQVALAAARVLQMASPEIRTCRDTRAAVRADVGDDLVIDLKIDGQGAPKDVKVHGGANDDESIDRCVQIVIEALIFPSSDLTVSIDVHQSLKLSPFRTSLKGRSCSSVSTLPLSARRGVWRERLVGRSAPPSLVYLGAKLACELPTWTDQRTFLELVLDVYQNGPQRVEIAKAMEGAGEPNAAALLRREALRRAPNPTELRRVEAALLAGERLPVGAFRKQYTKASDDAGRVAVVRRFLTIAPHDARLRRTLLMLLEALGKKDELLEQARIYRQDPFTDAVLLADIAAAIRRTGEELEARRAYGELSERAPDDPWVRAFLGDRLRNEGWFGDATLAYEALEELLPGDAGTGVRLALAHAGGGRLDVAQRMLARVAQTGGRAGDTQLGELAGYVAHALLAESRSKDSVSAADRDRLTRTALSLPFPESGAVFLARSPAGSVPIDVVVVRGPKESREERAPDLASPSIGLYAARTGASDGEVVLRLHRPEALPPVLPLRVRVDALVADGEGKPPRIVTTEVELPVSGKPVEVRWSEGAFVKTGPG